MFSVRQPCLYLRSSSPTTARKTHMAAPTPTLSKHGTCSCALCHEDLVKLQVQHGRRVQHSDFDLSCVKMTDFDRFRVHFLSILIYQQFNFPPNVWSVENRDDYEQSRILIIHAVSLWPWRLWNFMIKILIDASWFFNVLFLTNRIY